MNAFRLAHDQQLEAEIDGAIEELGISNTDLGTVDEATAERVNERFIGTFVEGSPGIWWFSLKGMVSAPSCPHGDAFKHIREYVPPNETRYWSIPERSGCWPIVYDATVCRIGSVLGICNYFDCYLVGTRFDWLVAEGEDQIFVCRANATDEIERGAS